jgi:hypothetical protein
MRKTVILCMMVFILSSTFADENSIELGNTSLSLQLFIYNNNHNNIFIDSNTNSFYYNNKYFTINYPVIINQNNRPEFISSQEKIITLFGPIIFNTLIIMDRQERELYNNMWEKQLQEEKMHHGIFSVY